MKEITIPGAVVPKPRQTQQDKWMKRPCVMRYRAWETEAQLRAGKVPVDACMIQMVFHLPMPNSWTRAKKHAMDGKLHQQKPDLDNCIKSVCDSLYPKADQGIAVINATKFWSTEAQARTEIRIN